MGAAEKESKDDARTSEWQLARKRLEETGDVTALATLLKNSEGIPTWVGHYVGRMLDPPAGYCGPKLRLRLPKRPQLDAVDQIIKKADLRERILAVKGPGQLEPAIAQVCKETGLSRATLFEVWKSDELEVARQIKRVYGISDRPVKK